MLSYYYFLMTTWKQEGECQRRKEQKNPDYLLISNLNNKLRLNQFLGTKITETNKSQKNDANEVC